MKMTGAEILLDIIASHGVEYVYGYPGGAVLPIYDAFMNNDKLKHVLTRGEQAAVHSASGYARATGKVGVCLATSGPGATNLVTGIATAYMDSIPIVAITGQVGTAMIGTDAFQEVDITGITMPITKHNYLVKDAKDLPVIIEEAFHIASTGRPGPVLIDIPRNVAEAMLDYKEKKEIEIPSYKPTYKGHVAQIKNAANMLMKAKKPVLFVGGGVISSGAWEEVMQLAETLQIPLAATLMGIGAFPMNHQLSLGMVGMHGHPAANYAVNECDLLVSLGVRFGDRVTGKISKFAPNAKIVHIDIDPAEIGKNVRVDLPIVGDIKTVLDELLKLIEEKENPLWLEHIADLKQKYPMSYGNRSGVRPQFVLETLSKLTKGEAYICTDVGQHQMWAAQYYQFMQPRHFISSGGLGTMGYGVPAAVGAQMGAPDQLVVSVSGDGSFQMNFAEIATAVEQGAKIKMLLFNNSTLSLVRQLQHFQCDKRYNGITFTGNPDFVQLATAYPGVVGYRITKNEDVERVMEEALSNGKITLIECVVSNEEMVYPVVPSGCGLADMIHNPCLEEVIEQY